MQLYNFMEKAYGNVIYCLGNECTRVITFNRFPAPSFIWHTQIYTYNHIGGVMVIFTVLLYIW
jgi:transposase-like protein